MGEELCHSARNIVLLSALAVQQIYLARDFSVKQKGDAGPLTVADLLSNSICQAGLSTLLPQAGWLSEETGDDDRRLSCSLVWVVDPIDGTREFVKQIPEYSISVGLVHDGFPILGVVAIPAKNQIIYGGQGLGVHMADYPADLSLPAPLHAILPDKMDFESVDSDQLLHRLQDYFHEVGFEDLPGLAVRAPSFSKRSELAGSAIQVSRSEWNRGKYKGLESDFQFLVSGSIARKLAVLAAGVGDLTVSLYPKNEWDICGGAALLQASPGGAIKDLAHFKTTTYNRKDTLSFGLVGGPRDLVEAFIDYFRDRQLTVEKKYS